jgi:outer membrane protein
MPKLVRQNSPGYLIVLLFVNCLSVPACAENLVDVFLLAQQNDPRWASARAAYEAGREKLPQGNALLLPTLSFTGSYTRSDSEIEYKATTTLPSGNRSFDTREYGLNLVHPLFRKQNYAGYQQAVGQVRVAELQLATASIDLTQRVSQAYFDLLASQDSVELSRTEVAAYAAQLEQANEQFKAGAVAITDVHEAQTRHDLARARQDSARNDLEIKSQQLRRITGKIPTSLSVLRDGLPPLPLEPPDVLNWIETAYAQSPRFLAQQQAVTIAEWEVARNRGAHLPTLDLVAGVTSTYSNGSAITSIGSDNYASRVGVQLQVPLYQGGSINSRVREAQANYIKAKEDLEDTKRDTELQVRQSYALLSSSASQIAALNQALRSAESAFESSEAGLDAGLRTRTDVLNAQQQVFSIRRDLLRARYDYYLNMLKLKAAAGTLSSDDLAQMNAALADTTPITPDPTPLAPNQSL